jgi:acyl-CoA reductase-like NAD-dependent aldehyde dehydrogenase
MAEATALQTPIESVNPATGDVFARFDATPTAALPEVMACARDAQISWAAIPIARRCAAIQRLRDVIFVRRNEIAEMVTRESGKPLAEALFSDVFICLDTADYLSKQAETSLRPSRVPHHSLAAKAKRGWLEYEPYGVIGIISPWNYPLAIPLGEAIAAVVAGNAVVLKPSELTPSCGDLIGELFRKSGFPDGLVQVVQGRGELGAALIEARPDKMVFTGSVATGISIASACAKHLIPSVLELGGKDAMIVLDDADLEASSSAAVWGSFTNCGQACVSIERIYVVRSVAEKFIERCTAKTKQLRMGSGLDPDTEIGPMIRPTQAARVQEQLRDAMHGGARILCGGHPRPDLGPCFFEPTVITAVNHSMALMRDETFGPVLAIQVVDSAAEAVALANDSRFGLSASVWTDGSEQGRQVARQLHVGSVMVNDVASYFAIAEAPHGGRGASGWGRTHSRIGLAELVQVKYIDVDRLPRSPKPWWFGYDAALNGAAGRFLGFLFAPRWLDRWRSARGAARTVFRGHRV